MRTRLSPGEELAAVVRRHAIVLAGPFALTLFLAGCAIGAFFVKRPYVLPGAGIALAVSVAWAFWRWLDWRTDLWAITSQRVIDESGVLSARAEDSPLDKINNVTCTQSLLGRMIGYGDLSIQTAAEAGASTLETLRHPMELKETILEQQEKARERSATRQAASWMAAAGQGRAVAGAAAQGVLAEETQECPYCAETIKARAKVCRYCGRSLR